MQKLLSNVDALIKCLCLLLDSYKSSTSVKIHFKELGASVLFFTAFRCLNLEAFLMLKGNSPQVFMSLCVLLAHKKMINQVKKHLQICQEYEGT